MNLNGGVEILTLGIAGGFLISFLLSIFGYDIYEVFKIMRK